MSTPGEQPVGQRPVQRLAVLCQSAVLLGHTGGGPLGRRRPLPGAVIGFVGAVVVEAARRAAAVLAVQMPLHPTQTCGVQADPIGQRLNPSRPGSVASFDGYRDLAGT
jgi:hypothetical protein